MPTPRKASELPTVALALPSSAKSENPVAPTYVARLPFSKEAAAEFWDLEHPAVRWAEIRATGVPTGVLPFATQLLLAAPLGLSEAVRWSLIWLHLFVADTHGFNAASILVVLTFSTLAELLTYPVLVRVSDSSRGSFGRRKPLLAIGTSLGLLVAVCEPTFRGWYGFPVVIFSLCALVFRVAHGALAVEISPVQGHRRSLLATCEMFSGLGCALGGLLPFLAQTGAIGEHSAEQLAVMLWASIAVLCIALGVATALLLIRVPERSAQLLREQSPPGSLTSDFIAATLNRAFRPLALGEMLEKLVQASAMSWIGLRLHAIAASNGADDDAARTLTPVIPAALCSFAVSLIVGVPLWIVAASKLGGYRAALLRKLVAAPTLLLVPACLLHGSSTMPLCIAAGAVGLSLSGSFLSYGLLASAIDYDHLLTGQRREATYETLFWLLRRLTVVLAIVGFAALHGSDDADPSAAVHVADVSSQVMAVLFLATVSLLAAVSLARCPISTDQQQLSIVSTAFRHQQRGEVVVDPVFAFTLKQEPQLTPQQARAHSLLLEFWPAELAFALKRRSACVLYLVPAVVATLTAILLGVLLPVIFQTRNAEHYAAALLASGLAVVALEMSLSRLRAIWRLRREGFVPDEAFSHDVLRKQVAILQPFINEPLATVAMGSTVKAPLEIAIV
jgi:Na+/melibiose symporter-like transporter